ncbi:hypothetical protein LPJ56_002427, partial [Coemansia sp. RSA 2599]
PAERVAQKHHRLCKEKDSHHSARHPQIHSFLHDRAEHRRRIQHLQCNALGRPVGLAYHLQVPEPIHDHHCLRIHHSRPV